MTFTETIDRLDKLVLEKAQTSEIRQVLFVMREQAEAIDNNEATLAALKESYAKQVENLQAEIQKMKPKPITEEKNWGSDPPIGGMRMNPRR
jgi:hypothetical protein